MKMTLGAKALLLVSIPLLFELVFIGMLATTLKQLENELAQEAHARDVSGHLNTLLRYVLDQGTSSVLFYLSSSNTFNTRAKSTKTQAEAEVDLLHALAKDRPEEEHALQEIHDRYEEFKEKVDEAKDLAAAHDRVGALRSWMQCQTRLHGFLKAIDQIIEQQSVILRRTRREQEEDRARVSLLLQCGVVCNILLAAMLVFNFDRGTARRFRTLQENLFRAAAQQPLGRLIRGDDEISQADEALHEVAREIAQLRRKEQAVIENAADIICSVGSDQRFVSANPAVLQLWGFAPDQIVGKRLSDLVHPDDLAQCQNLLKQIAQDSGKGSFECSITHKSGQEVQASWAVQWSNEEQSFFCVVRDITEKKRLENLKREFIAMVSHDLRTPLASLQMIHTLLANGVYGVLPETAHKNVVQAETTTGRLIALVTELLEVERLESGGLDLAREPVSISDAVDETVVSLKGFAKKHQVTLSNDVSDQILAYADRDRTIQILVNLVSNAIKFSPVDGTVEVRAEPLDQTIKISVLDRGRGVPEELRAKIFERFRQVSRDDRKKQSGAGLGLAICKMLVESHGGAIAVEARPDGGSVFWFTLPAPPATTAPSTTEPATTDSGTTDKGTTDKGTTDSGTTDTGTSEPGTT